jgi:hypothetical protein
MKTQQTLSGFIRQHLQDFESQLKNGIRQEVIVTGLEAHGYKTSVAVFRNLIWRARALNANAAITNNLGKRESQKPVTTNTGYAENSLQNEDINTSTFVSHNPSDLDDIQDQKVDLKSFAKFAKRNKK